MPSLRISIDGTQRFNKPYDREQSGAIAQVLLKQWDALEAQGRVIVTAEYEGVI